MITYAQSNGKVAISTFTFNQATIRTFTDLNSEPWFLANDVCSVLGYVNPRQAVQKNCKPKGVSNRDTPTSGGIQSMLYINEPNLYRLIIKSRKPEAEAFETWVMEEVLPQIRKTGQYQPNTKLTKEQQEELRRLVISNAERLPKDNRASAIIKTWSKLKAHFI